MIKQCHIYEYTFLEFSVYKENVFLMNVYFGKLWQIFVYDYGKVTVYPKFLVAEESCKWKIGNGRTLGLCEAKLRGARTIVIK